VTATVLANLPNEREIKGKWRAGSGSKGSRESVQGIDGEWLIKEKKGGREKSEGTNSGMKDQSGREAAGWEKFSESVKDNKANSPERTHSTKKDTGH